MPSTFLSYLFPESDSATNRNVQMDLIPSDMISSIEVNKTLTPDMDAATDSVSVNLNLGHFFCIPPHFLPVTGMLCIPFK